MVQLLGASQTEKGRALAIKYYKNLQNIFANIRRRYRSKEIDFVSVRALPDNSIKIAHFLDVEDM